MINKKMILIILLFVLCSCDLNVDRGFYMNDFYINTEDIEVNNSPVDKKAKRHSLSQLKEYFKDFDSSDFNISDKTLYLEDIDEFIPIEYFRCNKDTNYVVYPVEDGICVITFNIVLDSNSNNNRYCVSKFIYINSDLLPQQDIFNDAVGKTYDEIYKCSPSIANETLILSSSPPVFVSYSLLKNGKLVELTYDEVNNNYVVNGINILDREDVNCAFSDLLKCDIEYKST